ncbi:nucleoside hydrolase [Maribellus maritimus]|uniref:nucleoside hydrolase n=1 Tax=Maribellus maritimus TaxID=2870838 RepID=UPI001EEA4A5F|nr:nucleoside hydrolase [Maribellus maritimus]MCG6190624.1 nucleoside hydrolase [Maribellus maritimus]
MSYTKTSASFILSFFIAAILIQGCNSKEKSLKQAENKFQKPHIIFDTDIGGDYDDVGALAMIHALADNDEIEILATIASNLSPLVVPSIDVINTYFGRPNLPVGAPKTEGVAQDCGELHWSDSLSANYPHRYQKTSDALDAVGVYRKILAEQPDTSVTVVTVGFLTNLKNLLLSGPDSFSPLNGKDLVAKKVKLWVAMAGKFPEGKEYNVMKDSASSVYVIENWPGKVVFSGFEIGVEVLTGLRLVKDGAPDSPVRKVYAISIPKREYDKNGRRSWDQTAVLVAARGINPYFDVQKGKFIAHADGSNSWVDDPNGRHEYLLEKMPSDSLAYQIETLMMHTPN